jgi:hypothetical protein
MNLHNLMKWAAALLLIGVAAGGAEMGMWAPSAQPGPERPACADSAANRYRATMAGGATFEVVALSSHYPSGPKTWWRPDGTPLDEVPADRSQRVPFGKTGEELVDILVRLKGIPENATLKWVPTYDAECIHYSGGVTSGSVTKDGRQMPEMRAYIASFRRGRTNCAVRIQFAAGPWKTEVSDSGRSRYGGVTVVRDGRKIHFGLARPYRGGTTIAVAHNLVDINLHTRLVAVDLEGEEHPANYYADADAKTAHSYVNHFGREHPANYSSEAGGEILSMLDTEFTLPPDRLKEFLVQSRPFKRAEIKDIALQSRPADKLP